MTSTPDIPADLAEAGQFSSTYDKSLRLAPRFLPIVLLLLAIASASLSVGIVLEFGIWTHEEIIRGPFRTEAGTRDAWAPLGRNYANFSCCLGARPDVDQHSTASSLRAWLNGRELGPPHDAIRSGKTPGFIHWEDDTVRFVIPDSVANDETATLRILYPVQYSIEFFSLDELAIIVLIGLAGFCGLAHRTLPVLQAMLGAGIIASAVALAVYLLFLTAGYLTQQPAPETYLFRYLPIDLLLNNFEPLLPTIVMVISILSIGLNWAAGQDGRSIAAATRAQTQTQNLWRRFGFFSTAGILYLFVAASAWSGHVSAQDVLESNIGGFIPNSDAAGYFGGGLNYLIFDRIDPWNLRRPLAMLFRSETIALGNLNFVGTILVQIAALSFAIYWATNAIMKWRGVAAGLVFWAMAYVLFRPFAITTLTEPLALFWGFCSIPFLIHGMSAKSAPHLLVAIAFLFVALFIRMGAMFVIPLVVIWSLLYLGADIRQRLRNVLAVSLVLFIIIMSNVALDKLYGESDSELGGNFGSVLCGMSIGGSWKDCFDRYSDETKQMNEAQLADFFYRTAARNVLHDPRNFMRSMRSGLRTYRDDLYSAPTTWYRWPISSKILSLALYLVALAGWVWALRRRVDKPAMAFVIFVALGIITSVPFIYFSDARRFLYATDPLLALLIAGGFFTPAAARLRNDSLKWQTGAVPLAAAIIVALLLPFGLRLTGVTEPAREKLPQSTDNDRVIAGHRWQTGFIVLPDTAQPAPDLPSMSVTKFREFVRAGGQMPPAAVQDIPAPPFAVLVPFGASEYLGDGYISPPEVFADRSVQWWGLAVTKLKPTDTWFIVRSATPIK